MIYFPPPPPIYDYDFEEIYKPDKKYETAEVKCEVIEGETIRVVICTRDED